MYKTNESRGITLIALIITVIIMLILAGVSISILTSDGGLFYKTKQATAEYKKQSILEAVETARFQLEIEKQFNNSNDKINIKELIDELKEITNIGNDKNIQIDVDEDTQSAVIIDKKTGVVVEINIDETGKITTEATIVEDITDVIKPTIEYTIDPREGSYGETVKITITAKEEKHGITKIQFPDNTEKTYVNKKTVTEEYTVTENGRYKFVAENGNGRKATIYVEIKNAMKAADIIMDVKTTGPTNGNVEIELTYDENIKIGGQALTNEDRFQWSFGGINWNIVETSTETISVEENGVVYARYYDGTNGYKTVTTTVSNIDTTEPNAFNLKATATKDTVTVSVVGTVTDSGNTAVESLGNIATAPGNIGISGYSYQLKNSAGTVLVSWTEKQNGTSYTFSKANNNVEIPSDTEYKVSVKAIDLAGNEREATNKEYSIKTEKAGTPIASGVKVGDYVNYDAGTWTQADLNKITSSTGSPTLHSTVNDSISDNQKKPNTQGQFGGFELNQSRNSNSKEYNSGYKPRTAGWRVWNIEENAVTLISAGHPETYYHDSGESEASINILRNRDCSMYENSYAKTGSAKILTGQEAVAWYNKNFNTSYTLVENGGISTSTWYNETFSAASPIDVLENGSYYWLASSFNTLRLCSVNPSGRFVRFDLNNGYRGPCSSFSKVRSQYRYKQRRWKRRVTI